MFGITAAAGIYGLYWVSALALNKAKALFTIPDIIIPVQPIIPIQPIIPVQPIQPNQDPRVYPNPWDGINEAEVLDSYRVLLPDIVEELKTLHSQWLTLKPIMVEQTTKAQISLAKEILNTSTFLLDYCHEASPLAKILVLKTVLFMTVALITAITEWLRRRGVVKKKFLFGIFG
jgi:hypothetical protein